MAYASMPTYSSNQDGSAAPYVCHHAPSLPSLASLMSRSCISGATSYRAHMVVMSGVRSGAVPASTRYILAIDHSSDADAAFIEMPAASRASRSSRPSCRWGMDDPSDTNNPPESQHERLHYGQSRRSTPNSVNIVAYGGRVTQSGTRPFQSRRGPMPGSAGYAGGTLPALTGWAHVPAKNPPPARSRRDLRAALGDSMSWLQRLKSWGLCRCDVG